MKSSIHSVGGLILLLSIIGCTEMKEYKVHYVRLDERVQVNSIEFWFYRDSKDYTVRIYPVNEVFSFRVPRAARYAGHEMVFKNSKVLPSHMFMPRIEVVPYMELPWEGGEVDLYVYPWPKVLSHDKERGVVVVESAAHVDGYVLQLVEEGAWETEEAKEVFSVDPVIMVKGAREIQEEEFERLSFDELCTLLRKGDVMVVRRGKAGSLIRHNLEVKGEKMSAHYFIRRGEKWLFLFGL